MAHTHAAVIGIGMLPFRTHHADRNYVELAQEAAARALEHAGLVPDDIDAIVFSMAPTQFMGVNDCERWAVDSVWGAGKPFMRVSTGGATGGSAFQAGYQHVASGMFRCVMIVGADRVAETPDAQHVLNLIWDRFYEHDFALNTVTMTSLAAQRYMHKYGVTEEQFAQVVVRARKNAAGNEFAHLRKPVTVERGHGKPPRRVPVQALRHLPPLLRRRRGHRRRHRNRQTLPRHPPRLGARRLRHLAQRLHGRPRGPRLRYRVRGP